MDVYNEDDGVILSEEDDYEDENDDEGGDGGKNTNTGDEPGASTTEAAPTAEALKEGDQKKKRKLPKPFNEDTLVSVDGLMKIYVNFPALCQFRGKGFEAQDLKKLMALYTEWGFQLNPTLNIEDMIGRIEKLGTKARLRAHLGTLRDMEMKRYLKEVYDIDHVTLEATDRESAARTVDEPATDMSPQEQIETTTTQTGVRSNLDDIDDDVLED